MVINELYATAALIGISTAVLCGVPFFWAYQLKTMKDPLLKAGWKRGNIVYRVTDLHRRNGTKLETRQLIKPDKNGCYSQVSVLSYNEDGTRIIKEEIWDLGDFDQIGRGT